jgi:predicted acylesterase/phospholipase RssA
VLRELEQAGVLKIQRAAGASSGALAAGSMGCECPPRDWYRLHDAWWVLHARYG